MGIVAGATFGLKELFKVGMTLTEEGSQTGDYGKIFCGIALQGLLLGGAAATAYYAYNRK